MNLVRQDDIVVLETPGGNHSSTLVSRTRGATDICIYRQQQQPGGQNPPHYHDREEIFLLQSGVVRVTVDRQQSEIHAGDVLIVPPNAVHFVATISVEPSEWLIIAREGLRFFRPDGEEVFADWAR